MKCLFIYKTASLDITDPIGIMCLIANIKKHGHEADLGSEKYCRIRSVDNVVREIEQVRRDYPLSIVYFHDDLFIMNKTWLKDFAAEYKKRVGMPMICYVRANLVNEEVVQHLKEANCITIAMGVESGNEVIREKVLKRIMTNEQIVGAGRLFHKYGISVMTQNMVGLPEETIEDAYQTIEINRHIRPAYAWVSLFQPYPRTEMHRYCIEKGYLDPSHVQHASYQVESPINKGMTKRQFENLHKFFALAIEFPFVLRMSHHLIRWPKNVIFNVTYRLFKGYTHIFRLKMSSGEIGFFGYLWGLLGYRIRWCLGKTF